MYKTLEYYNEAAKEYVKETRDASMSDLNNMFLGYLPDRADILDLGCGSGRDSKIFIDKGHRVTAMDGSIEFCKLASDYLGQEVICKKFDEIDYKDQFDGVWACASILHTPSKDLNSILTRIAKSLKRGGYFFTCFKFGDFEGERKGRYFTDLTEMKLKKIIGEIADFEVIETFKTSDVRPGRANEEWVNVIVRKKGF